MWQFSLNFVDLLKWLGPLLVILFVAVFFRKEKISMTQQAKCYTKKFPHLSSIQNKMKRVNLIEIQ